ncbi:unnamed protein product [Miscanthus lutarioriparius]|uniref:Uncharacterized protein n=1 Tax=Miscanthus lutarioriparius TaxID=422564 RepID=A0A811MCP3_9POAL|nr:unnamed protein product [Miscanthus lutarioriparius]
MGFIHRRTSKQTSKVKTLLGLALSRLAAARRPRLARKSISRSDVGQLLALRHLDRALHRLPMLHRLYLHVGRAAHRGGQHAGGIQHNRAILQSLHRARKAVRQAPLVWKLSGNKRNMELKKKVVKEIAAENNVLLEFSEQDGSSNVPHHHELNHEAIYQTDMDESSESDSYHSPSRNKDPCDMSNSDGTNNGQPKQKNMKTSVCTRR